VITDLKRMSKREQGMYIIIYMNTHHNVPTTPKFPSSNRTRFRHCSNKRLHVAEKFSREQVASPRNEGTEK